MTLEEARTLVKGDRIRRHCGITSGLYVDVEFLELVIDHPVCTEPIIRYRIYTLGALTFISSVKNFILYPSGKLISLSYDT